MRSDAPLNAWRDGPAKRTILDFVSRVTDMSGPDFVAAPGRVAVFDNDGTLWCEHPAQVEIFYFLDRLADLAKVARRDARLRERQPFKAFLEKDVARLAGHRAEPAFEFDLAAHVSVTPAELERIIRRWYATEKHPQRGRTLTDNIYVPQTELLTHLQANGFRTIVVAGGGLDLIWPQAAGEYVGIVPEEGRVHRHFEISGGAVQLLLQVVEGEDAPGNGVSPHHAGLNPRPILACGNADIDIPMLRYVRAGEGPSLVLLLHHDDAEREFAYDGDFAGSPLVEGLRRSREYGFTIVSMKDDWATVFERRATKRVGQHHGRNRQHQHVDRPKPG